MDYFENISDQEFACKLLKNQLANNRTSHAYLFCGPAGSGKLECAKAFAKTLLGDNFAQSIDNNVQPDVLICYPEGIHGYLIGQIKNIVNDSNLAPIQSKKKVYIINDADKLSSAAANAFLKTLEEPAIHICFILLANSSDNVLPTIVSRCQVITFKSIPYEKAVNKVQKGAGCALDDAKKALNLYGGNVERAINFCLNQNTQDFYSEVLNIIQSIDSLSDWDLLMRSNDLVSKIKEIVSSRKADLDNRTKEMSEILEKSAISIIEDQNKRNLAAVQRELLSLFCSTIKLYYRDLLLDKKFEARASAVLNLLSEIETNLSYNISAQNFCDVVLLKVKSLCV